MSKTRRCCVVVYICIFVFCFMTLLILFSCLFTFKTLCSTAPATNTVSPFVLCSSFFSLFYFRTGILLSCSTRTVSSMALVWMLLTLEMVTLVTQAS